MSKYIKLFDTEEEYNSALPNLDLPNVSLIDSTGEVKFNNIKYGAEPGDIVLYDKVKSKFVIIKPDDYNTSTYPTSTYGVVGVAVFENLDGLRVVGANELDCSTDPYNYKQFKWQNTIFNWGLPKLNGEKATVDFDGKSNTKTIIDAIKAYDVQNSTDNITGNIPQYIQEYQTDGTLPGEWYAPAVAEFFELYDNKTVIDKSLNKVGVILYGGGDFWTSSEYNTNKAYYVNILNGMFGESDKDRSCYIRPFLLLN